MRSGSDVFGKLVDVRNLYLSMKFWGLSEDQIRELGSDLYNTVNKLLNGKCVLDWRINDKTLKKLEQIEQAAICDCFSIDLTANVFSKTVYNKVSQKKYGRKLEYDLPYVTWPYNSNESVDYKQSYSNLFNGEPSGAYSIKESLVKLYSLENQVYKHFIYQHDIICYLMCDDSNNGKYEGTVVFWSSVYCLDKDLNSVADVLYQFCVRISRRFNSVSAFINFASLQTDFCGCCNELNLPDYFKNGIVSDEAQLFEHVAEKAYIKGLGWANVISPMHAALLGDNIEKEGTENVEVKVLENRAVSVKIKDGIDRLQLSDLKTVKRIMYPCLYPGHTEFPLNYKFRSMWEYVPVLDDEITVTDNSVIFRINREPDLVYLKKFIDL